jgi:large subunit ribosomal protein L29
MKYADIAGLSVKELVKKTKELRRQVFEANMKNALGQLTNPMTIREMRRNVARMQTALTARAGGEAVVPKKAASGRKTAKAAAKG